MATPTPGTSKQIHIECDHALQANKKRVIMNRTLYTATTNMIIWTFPATVTRVIANLKLVMLTKKT
ncbi:unnamed protein product [Acanthoscelides obtectus]|uniref:Uncharacterized protein n=1 Tax=Acanthoscelides obtectus TaxID=200917 RepID=A0A9P0MCK0_ACAOB|nr:unnamed protein product [Acanthoscelides obtectus]CAK1658366.1 hypothetical protein AOBTE_LOCUS20845 [Acanthoscelides obtectus]